MTDVLSIMATAAVSRFPRPEFDGGHVIPTTSAPLPSGAATHMLDLAALGLALAFAAYIALRWRSRRAMAGLSIFSLVYFGFVRHGCLCSIGALQNVSLALFDASAPAPWLVFAYFAGPLVFALFFGRVFCGGVCPLGMIQDVVAWRPVKIPRWLERALGLFPYVYLAAAVLFAATGTAFLICRFDPFVGFFRFSGPLPMMLAGTAVLLVGMFVARPYCRFVCPYGVLLRWASLVAWRRMTIAPVENGKPECVNCALCADSCPYGALRAPVPPEKPKESKRRFGALARALLLAPVIVAASGYAGHLISKPLAGFNREVKLAAVLDESPDALPFDAETAAAVRERAASVECGFAVGATAAGIFLGLVAAFSIVALSTRQTGDHFRPDAMKCLSCLRCVEFCPIEKSVRGASSTVSSGD